MSNETDELADFDKVKLLIYQIKYAYQDQGYSWIVEGGEA
jgi:hypothetical protein